MSGRSLAERPVIGLMRLVCCYDAPAATFLMRAPAQPRGTKCTAEQTTKQILVAHDQEG